MPAEPPHVTAARALVTSLRAVDVAEDMKRAAREQCVKARRAVDDAQACMRIALAMTERATADIGPKLTAAMPRRARRQTRIDEHDDPELDAAAARVLSRRRTAP